MPITRTPWIDDDGTGTTGTIVNNAEKQLLYDQIDALAAGMAAATYGTWTPLDYSGATLAFTGAYGIWAKLGRVVHFWCELTYPTTASGINAWIVGLPFDTVVNAGVVQGFGIQRVWRTFDSIPVTLIAYHPTTGAAIKNSDLSGATLFLSGTYCTG